MKKIIAVWLAVLAFAVSLACAESVPAEQEPWTGDGHWYTFQLVPSGLVTSGGAASRSYLVLGPLYYPAGDGVVIGKLKGMTTNISVCTADPEERVIWVYDPPYRQCLILEGTEIPDQDPATAGLDLRNDDTNQGAPMSEEAREEYLALLEKMTDVAEGAADQLESFGILVSMTYPELPGLLCWLKQNITELDGRTVLLSWRIEERSDGLEFIPERVVEVDPEGALYRECAALAAAQDGETPSAEE